MEYVDSIRKMNLSEEEQLLVVKLAVDIIEADNVILYSEVKFFKRIRRNLTISDELILSKFPDKEDYLLPDIIEPMDKQNWNYNFELIWRKRSIPTHSNGSIHSLLSPKIGLRSA